MDMQTKDFYYCSNRKCNKVECLRYWRNTPWNKLFVWQKCEPNKNGICEDFLEDNKYEN